MRLKKLELQDFCCFDNFEMEFDDQLKVIVSKNERKKNDILNAIAINISRIFTHFYGIRSVKLIGEKYTMNTKISTEVETKSIDNQKIDSFFEDCIADIYKDDELIKYGDKLNKHIMNGDMVKLPIFTYYTSNRVWNYNLKKSDNFPMSNRRLGYLNYVCDGSNIRPMINWFITAVINNYQNAEIGEKENDCLKAVYKIIEDCYYYFRFSKSKSKVKVSFILNKRELQISHIDKNRWHLFSELPEHLKNILSLVSNIAYRMASLNPQLGENVCNETNGIVLIDNIELGIDEKRPILSVLSTLFPKVQFIVTTNSENVISNIDEDNISRI